MLVDTGSIISVINDKFYNCISINKNNNDKIML